MNRGQSVFAQLLGFVPFSHFVLFARCGLTRLRELSGRRNFQKALISTTN